MNAIDALLDTPEKFNSKSALMIHQMPKSITIFASIKMLSMQLFSSWGL